MTCDRVLDRLSELIDDETDAGLRAELGQHLSNCPGCTRIFRELALLKTASAEIEPVNPPDRLFAEIRRAVRQRRQPTRSGWRRAGWVLGPALATAALMLVVAPRRPGTAPTFERPFRKAELAAPQAEPVEPPRSARQSGVPTVRQTGIPASGSVRAQGAVAVPGADPVRVSQEGPTRSSLDRTTMLEAELPAEPPVLAGLREVQHALEEIEAALHRNPGNPQVMMAYQAMYRKGVELRNRYLGAR